MDMLEEMFDTQKKLMKMYFNRANSEKKSITLTGLCIAMAQEVAEVMDETNWKWWKKPKKFNPEKFLEELVDLWHFLMQSVILAGFSAKDFYRAYMDKALVNVKRQEEGY